MKIDFTVKSPCKCKSKSCCCQKEVENCTSNIQNVSKYFKKCSCPDCKDCTYKKLVSIAKPFKLSLSIENERKRKLLIDSLRKKYDSKVKFSNGVSAMHIFSYPKYLKELLFFVSTLKSGKLLQLEDLEEKDFRLFEDIGHTGFKNFVVDGLHCQNCVSKVKKALASEDEKVKCEIDLKEKRMIVQSSLTNEKVCDIVKSLGYFCKQNEDIEEEDDDEETKEYEFFIDGLKCLNCVDKVKRYILALDDTIVINIDLSQKKMIVKSTVDYSQEIEEIIKNIGFYAERRIKTCYKIGGLHCQNCVSKVTNSSKEKLGDALKDLRIDLEKETMETVSSEEIADRINEVVKELGFTSSVVEIQEQNLELNTSFFFVDGLHCQNCVNKVTNGVKKELGDNLISLDIDLENKKMKIVSTKNFDEKVNEVVKSLGFFSKIIVQDGEKENKEIISNFFVDGLHCQNCVNKVTNGIKEFGDDVKKIDIDLEKKEMVIVSQVEIEEKVNEIVKNLGFFSKVKENEQNIRTVFFVDGLHCQNCVNKVTKGVKEEFGEDVSSVSIDLEKKKMVIISKSEIEEKVNEIVKSLGFFSKRLDEEEKLDPKTKTQEEIVIHDEKHEKEENEQVEDTVIEIEGMNKCELSVEGISCSSCVQTIMKAVSNIDGLEGININVLTQRARIVYDKEKVSIEKIVKTICSVGYPAAKIEENSEGSVFFTVGGNKNVDKVENALKEFKNKEKIMIEYSFNKKNDSVNIIYDENVTNPRKLLEYVEENCGIALKIKTGNQTLKDSLLRKKEKRFYLFLFIFCAVFAIPAMFLALLFGNLNFFKPYLDYKIFRSITPKTIALLVLCTPVQFIAGYKISILGLKALIKFSPDKNTLIALGAWSAYIVSIVSIVYGLFDADYKGIHYLESSASLIMFITLGRYLENIGKSKTTDALVMLLNMQPEKGVLVCVENKEEFMERIGKREDIPEKEVDHNLIFKNDILKVLPGQKIPIDGEIILGQSLVDESLLTGESVPVSKKIGDEVIGGTINLDGVLYMKVNRVGGETILNKIIKLIESTSSAKQGIEKLADKISKYFAPAIIFIAFFVLGLWLILVYFVVPESWMKMNKVIFSVMFATSALVIACPCSLGLATPLATMTALGLAGKMGILIKGGDVIENLNSAKVVCFDKTGTLTEGKLKVQKMDFVGGETKDKEGKDREFTKDEIDVMKMIIMVEKDSTHPIAKAVVSHLMEIVKENGVSENDIGVADDTKALPGKGVLCNLQGKIVLVGNTSLMNENGIEFDAKEFSSGEYSGKTLMLVAVDGKLRTVIGLEDTIKEGVKDVLSVLRKKFKMGIVMLTGDNASVAEKVCKELDIDEYHAGMTPFGKTELIKEIQEKRKERVVFVGDGINDSGALTQSNVGIAVGSGTEIALECSKIVLLQEDLDGLVYAIDIAKKTYRKILFNLFWAFVYNIVALPLAAGALYPLIRLIDGGYGIFPPWVGAIAMSCSSISVTVNSLLLRVLYKKPKIHVD